jgi:hypothetical protein
MTERNTSKKYLRQIDEMQEWLDSLPDSTPIGEDEAIDEVSVDLAFDKIREALRSKL